MVDCTPALGPATEFLDTEVSRLGNHLSRLEISWYIVPAFPFTLVMTLTSIPSYFSPGELQGKQMVVTTLCAHTPGAFSIFRKAAIWLHKQLKPRYPMLGINVPNLDNINLNWPPAAFRKGA